MYLGNHTIVYFGEKCFSEGEGDVITVLDHDIVLNYAVIFQRGLHVLTRETAFLYFIFVTNFLPLCHFSEQL